MLLSEGLITEGSVGRLLLCPMTVGLWDATGFHLSPHVNKGHMLTLGTMGWNLGSHGLQCHQYANDSQLCFTFQVIPRMLCLKNQCLAVMGWMTKMELNSDKTGAL